MKATRTTGGIPGTEAHVFRERLGSIEALVGMADSLADSFLQRGMVQKLGLKVLVASAQRRRRKRRVEVKP